MSRFSWDDYYRKKIEAEWNALPTVKTRLRGKLDPDDGVYHAQPVIELALTVEQAEALRLGFLCNTEVEIDNAPPARFFEKLREAIEKASKPPGRPRP